MVTYLLVKRIMLGINPRVDFKSYIQMDLSRHMFVNHEVESNREDLGL